MIIIPTEFRLYNVDENSLFKNKTQEEKLKIIPKMVEYALKYGNKPAARHFNTYPSTVRRYVNLYKKKG